MTKVLMKSPGEETRRMFHGRRYVTSAVLALALVVSVGRAQGGGVYLPARGLGWRGVETPTPIHPTSTASSWSASSSLPIGKVVTSVDAVSHRPTEHVCCHSEPANPDSPRDVRRALPAYDGPKSDAGRDFLASLTARGLQGNRQDPAYEPALRGARSGLLALLHSAAMNNDRFWLCLLYREAHRLLFNEPVPIGRLGSTRGYLLMRQDIVTVPTRSTVHVYGRPFADAEGKRFTGRELLLPAETELYVLDTEGSWSLVAHPGDSPGPFVGWIQMDRVTWIPGRTSPAVAAIVLEHRQTR